MVSLVRLMLFTTTVEILMVRTGSVQTAELSPDPYFSIQGSRAPDYGNTSGRAVVQLWGLV